MKTANLKFIIFLLIILLIKPAHSFIDLFLDSNETSNILGFSNNFFYVFNGELRQNSINYLMDIPENKHSIEFSWRTNGPMYLYVDYDFKLINLNYSNKSIQTSINSAGLVPSKLSKFQIEFNCENDSNKTINSSMKSTELLKNKNNTNVKNIKYMDISFSLNFKINKNLTEQSLSSLPLAQSASFQLKLATSSNLNLTINYRKHCSSRSLQEQQLAAAASISVKSLSAANGTASFAIAYITIAALIGFSLLIFLVAFVMFINGKSSKQNKILVVSNLNSKYDLSKKQQQLLQQQQQQQQQRKDKIYALNKQHYQSKHDQQTSSDNQLLNSGDSCTNLNNINKCKYLSKSKLGLANTSSKHQEDTNYKCEDGNLYESLHEPSNNVNDKLNQQQRTIVSSSSVYYSNNYNNRGGNSILKNSNKKNMLNLTTNTIQSNMNNLSIADTVVSINTNINRMQNNVDVCKKYKKEFIELGNVYMEGTFSRIYEATLKKPLKKDNAKRLSMLKKKPPIDESSPLENDDEELEDNTLNRDDLSIKEQQHYEIIKVFAKMPSVHASIEQCDLMLREACILRGLKHKNVLPVMGICFNYEANRPVALFALNEIGNLKTYLTKIRLSYNDANSIILPTSSHLTKDRIDQKHTISIQELLFIVLQMLKGINYIHSRRIIHKDIATRNCWLNSSFQLKLADYALSRDLFPDDYSCLANNENKPICWMSLESLRNNVYNVKTDVWSCGVTIWECMSLADQPYSQIDPFELSDYLEENESNRLEKPTNCSNDLFNLLIKCWQKDSSMRPSLKELFQSIHKLYSSLNNYV